MISPVMDTIESDAYKWYVQKMKPVMNGPVYTYQGKVWTLRYEYRYGNYTFGFFQSEDEQWALDVNEEASAIFNPNMGIYSSYQDMLVGLAHRYSSARRFVTS